MVYIHATLGVRLVNFLFKKTLGKCPLERPKSERED
jgi:hypothetical protein